MTLGAYKKPLIFAVALHFVLFILIFIKTPGSGQSLFTAKEQPKIVQATAISQTNVEQQIQAIKHQEQQKRAEEQARLDKIRQQANAARAARQKEQAQVAQLKAQKQALNQAKQQRAEQLATLKKQMQEAQNEMLNAKKQADQQKQRLALAKETALKTKQDQLQQQLMQNQLTQENQQLQQIQQQQQQQQQQQMQGAIDQFRNQILGQVGDNWLIDQNWQKDLKVTYLLHLAPDGTVLSATLVKSSGNNLLDQSARVAIMKSSPLPVPKDPNVFGNFREFRLTLSPQTVKKLA